MSRTELEAGEQRLRKAGHKLTPQRKAILGLFAADTEHWTPQEVYQALEETMPSLSLATVYNTLEVFDALGIVRRVTAVDGTTYFDTNLGPHFHATCQGCGEVFDVAVAASAVDDLIDATESIDAPGGKVMQVANIWFRGICPDCASQAQKK